MIMTILSWLSSRFESFVEFSFDRVKDIELHYGCPASNKAAKLQMKRKLYR